MKDQLDPSDWDGHESSGVPEWIEGLKVLILVPIRLFLYLALPTIILALLWLGINWLMN